ncbi:restriction endonuclease subunit S [Brachybacterium timonense]|uniref:restriction endonuclease subunit S n=1 Tax=Brachybacterium timonense TaxID=2050896 RepID=UPI000D0B2301|nr:restriction endonuclease subunit S [Brachybacterium timonense]
MRYARVPLGEVAAVERRSIKPDAIDLDLPYLGLEHIERGGHILDHPTAGEAELKSSKFLFTPQHLLYGKLRPYLAKIALPQTSGVCSTDILPVLPGPSLDRSYLAHYLRQEAMVEFANSRSSGANLPRLSPMALKQFPIPLPPLEDQRRIAAILNQADAIRTKYHRFRAHLEALPNSWYRSKFSSTWPLIPLSELITSHQIGLNRRASAQGPDLAYEYVKMDAITSRGTLQLDTLTRIDANLYEVSNFTLEEGDLIFNTRNSRDLVGKSAVYCGPPRLYNNNIMRLRFKDSTTAPFVHAYFWSARGRYDLEAIKSGTTSIFAIYAKDLLRLPIPLADAGTRQSYANIVLASRAKLDKLRSILDKHDELFASLQSRAFTGEL